MPKGNKPWLNFPQLLYFKTIALEGNIAKAAKKLLLGQPTLSTQMKQFEDVLGFELFDRSKRRLELSEAGRLVLRYALEIFKLSDEMLDSLNDQHFATKVQVQLGAADTVPKHLSLKVYQFAQKYKDCVVSIAEGHGDELMRLLRAHRIDLVLSNYPPPVGEASGFYAKCIAKMNVIVCGTQKYAGLKKNFPESLAKQPFVMPSLDGKLRHDVEHFLKLRDIHVDVVAEIQDTALQKLLGTHGDGLVPIAETAAEELIKNKDLIEIGKLEGIYEELWLIAGQRRIQNPVAAAIMKEFKL
jgi:LysR family transcriptional activator of nhaA